MCALIAGLFQVDVEAEPPVTGLPDGFPGMEPEGVEEATRPDCVPVVCAVIEVLPWVVSTVPGRLTLVGVDADVPAEGPLTAGPAEDPVVRRVEEAEVTGGFTGLVVTAPGLLRPDGACPATPAGLVITEVRPVVTVGPDREMVGAEGFWAAMLVGAAVGRGVRWMAVLVVGVMDEGVLLMAGLEGIGRVTAGLGAATLVGAGLGAATLGGEGLGAVTLRGGTRGAVIRAGAFLGVDILAAPPLLLAFGTREESTSSLIPAEPFAVMPESCSGLVCASTGDPNVIRSSANAKIAINDAKSLR